MWETEHYFSSFNIWFHKSSFGLGGCHSFSQAVDLQTWTAEVPGTINVPSSTPLSLNQAKSAAFLRSQSPDSSASPPVLTQGAGHFRAGWNLTKVS